MARTDAIACLLGGYVDIASHLGGQIPQTYNLRVWIGVFKQNMQNIKTFIYQNYIVDPYQILHNNKITNYSMCVVQVCVQQIQYGGAISCKIEKNAISQRPLINRWWWNLVCG